MSVHQRPLVVDLDGTLIHTDMLHESVIELLRHAPWKIAYVPIWLMQGKAHLKQILADQMTFNPSSLPYNQALISWLQEQKLLGRTLILCSAANHGIAKMIASHLGCFDEVIASEGSLNLSGENKAKALEKRFGKNGFDYIGNSNKDLPVWKCARRAIVVNAPKNLVRKAKDYCEIERVFPKVQLDLKVVAHVFRVHQWLKNLLLFVPIIAGHQLNQLGLWLTLLFAFFSFSTCASAVYIVNDLLDLENDRLHPRKYQRPFAAGRVPIVWGIGMIPILLCVSLLLGSFVNSAFLTWLMFYFYVTVAYSFSLKRYEIVDCFTLAVLYTLRLIAGAVAVGLNVTFWLLGFSMFLFLSLAFVKRYTELFHQGEDKGRVHGRGYLKSDMPLIQILGIASGYAAVIVLAFYMNSDAIIRLYPTRECVWGTVPIMLFWINWIWLKTHRGLMHDDPLIFAIKDQVSCLTGFLFALLFYLGTLAWL